MKVFTLSLLCIILFVALPTAATDVEDDEEAKKDLSIERAPRLTRLLRRRQIQTECPIVRFPCSRMPDVCANMRNAILLGEPRLLTRTTDRSQIRRNRRKSCFGRLPRRHGFNCDEYPFASTFQGGSGAVVKLVPIRENSIQGGVLGAFYRRNRIGHGGCFMVGV